PDAPDPKAPKMTWVHWVLYNLPASASGLPEAVAPSALPSGTKEGKNDWKRTGDRGPRPPIRPPPHVFQLVRLRPTLPGPSTPAKAQLEAAMKGHVLAQAEVTGTYEKAKKKP